MCQKCIFRVQKFPKSVLVYRDKIADLDRNQFQAAARTLCKHDRKRLAFARRYAQKDWMPIIEFLKIGLGQGKPFVPWVDLLITYGQDFRTPDCSEHMEFDEFSYGNCYGMAHLVHREIPEMQYAEGLSWSFPEHLDSLPLWHAWNINPKGGVVDFTWPMSHWVEYFGIVFDLDWVKENCIMECGIFHPENWPHNEERVRHYLNLKWLEEANAKGGGR